MIYIDYVEVGKHDSYDKLVENASLARRIHVQFVLILSLMRSMIIVNMIHVAAVILCQPDKMVTGGSSPLVTVFIYIMGCIILSLIRINETKCEMCIPDDMNVVVVNRLVVIIITVICIIGSCANISMAWAKIDITCVTDVSLLAPTIALTLIVAMMENSAKSSFGRDYLQVTSQMVPIMDDVIKAIIQNKWWLSPDRDTVSELDIRRLLQEHLNY